MGDPEKVGNLTLTLAEEILKDYQEERRELCRWIYESTGKWKLKGEESVEDTDVPVLEGGSSWFGGGF